MGKKNEYKGLVRGQGFPKAALTEPPLVLQATADIITELILLGFEKNRNKCAQML